MIIWKLSEESPITKMKRFFQWEFIKESLKAFPRVTINNIYTVLKEYLQ